MARHCRHRSSQGLGARGLVNILGAAIGEGVQGESVAAPEEGAMRGLAAITRRSVNTTSRLKGKPEMVLAGPGNGDAGHRLMAVHGVELVVQRAGHRPTNGSSPRPPGQGTAPAAHKARNGWNKYISAELSRTWNSRRTGRNRSLPIAQSWPRRSGGRNAPARLRAATARCRDDRRSAAARGP